MDQTQVASSSVQSANTAWMAQYKAKQASLTSSSQDGEQVSFAKTLGQVGGTQATTASAASTTQETTSSCDPKISRSARMACAEKATHVDYEDDDFSFGDLVDLLNPLQHIPVVGAIYRELTGDEIKPEVQVAGSVLFGVATGSVLLSAATGIASAALESNTGKEPTIQVAESIFGDGFLNTPDPLAEDKITTASSGGEIDPDASPNTVHPPAPTRTAAATSKSATTKVADATASASATAASASANASSTVASNKTTPGLLTATGGMRVGNTIYTGPMMRSASRVHNASSTSSGRSKRTATVTPVSTQASTTTQNTTQSAPQSAAATTSSTAASGEASNVSLGTQMQQQALAHEAGQALPPQLVQDMMLKALDKYKAANLTTSGTDGIDIN